MLSFSGFYTYDEATCADYVAVRKAPSHAAQTIVFRLFISLAVMILCLVLIFKYTVIQQYFICFCLQGWCMIKKELHRS